MITNGICTFWLDDDGCWLVRLWWWCQAARLMIGFSELNCTVESLSAPRHTFPARSHRVIQTAAAQSGAEVRSLPSTPLAPSILKQTVPPCVLPPAGAQRQQLEPSSRFQSKYYFPIWHFPRLCWPGGGTGRTEVSRQRMAGRC